MLFDNAGDSLEFGDASIAHALIQEALRAGDNRSLSPQSVQRNTDFFRVTALDGDYINSGSLVRIWRETYRNSVRQNIDFVSFAEQIQGRLRDANMGLNTHDHNLTLL